MDESSISLKTNFSSYATRYYNKVNAKSAHPDHLLFQQLKFLDASIPENYSAEKKTGTKV